MPAPRKSKPKTVPKSFRVDESVSIAVEDEAASRNVSSNTLVNQILKQFSEFDRIARRISTVKLSSSIFRELLTEVDSEKVIEIAKSAGSSIPQAFATTKSGKVDVESFVDHIRCLGLYAHLYEFTETVDGRVRLLTLVHDFGLNWSIFLVHYVNSMFEQVGVSPKVEMSDRSVTFTLSS